MSGRDEVGDWIRSWRKKNFAYVLSLLDDLQRLKKENWPPSYFSLLKGKSCAGLAEIRLKVDRVNYRIISFFGPRQRELTMLLIAVEKDWKFTPRDYCEIGQRRRAEVMANMERARELGSK
jgi:hypothetical protein